MAQLDPQVISEIRERLRDFCDPKDVFLFGSYAEGTANEQSDVDLLIVMPDGRPVGRKSVVQARQVLNEVLHGRNLAFDLLMKSISDFDRFKDIPGTIQYEVANKGVSIYA